MKISEQVKNMNNSIQQFLHEHTLDLEYTGGVFDSESKCIIYYDTRNSQDQTKYKVFNAIIAATYSQHDGSLIWCWGSQNFPEHLSQDSIVLREYGLKNEIPEFAERYIITNPQDEVGIKTINILRAMRNFKDGFKSKIAMSRDGGLYSRLTIPEIYGIISTIVGAKMSSTLPFSEYPEINSFVFITDSTPLNSYTPSPSVKNYLGIP